MQSDKPNPPSFYLNIHTADPEAGLAFYTAIGFTHIKEYSDDKTKAFRLPEPNQTICLMIHANARFKEFIRSGTQIVDATKTTEALFSIAVESKQSVDIEVTKAVEAGGIADPYMLPNYGSECGMYTRSFADLDGHMWELVAMVGSCGENKQNC
ncbi:hypothetical protein BFJ63_vAg18349 [Fusarium oxysporum f. sp. narcissi]|uniref:VOC domain-containing protein n=4 Tax=Fusarium oxysporum TaxID=5507 RepID=A0A420NM35_FUSOX|nr:hypothetical protein FOVG_17430 [Fusarium oxysporum f. sp. pisi HDV247]KAG7416625.1 hypothetical protein Forpi1262_v016667 [Fusarium oxysporum f. sp. raphani]KAH7142549.1 hypothetical protein DER46DRAFT_619675 [Fusarium sp. MPI-SDFR-AT-0072]KAH7202820.1 hypothetical protein BKA60DRAFT_162366 [Fusarium oxysporum]RYC78777.1 hypothetical protein BFJ63_vAg18349 [Fusarium oxysporum f. sp. narcissi]